LASLWWVAANSLGPLVGATLLRRLRQPGRAARAAAQPAFVLIFGALAGPALTATLGTIGTSRISEGSIGTLWQVWPSYLLSDALGVLVSHRCCWRGATEAWPRHPAEVGALTVALLAVGLVALARRTRRSLRRCRT
jgi:integral membrane sensor domain MASE1